MRSAISSALRLKPGDWVEVRSQAEILATLDGNGALDGLPFMSEMLGWCGRRFRVAARADRTVHDKLGVRRMRDTVHLDEPRCDGAAHDGCCRGCLIFWKEAWLRRVSSPAAATEAPQRSRPVSLRVTVGERWYCQATELERASQHVPLLDFRLDLRAPSSEGLSPRVLFHSLAILGYDILQHQIGGPEWNALSGPCVKTPSVSLNLKPGERVRVKSELEIRATLDTHGWNRGMEFSREMIPYCGSEQVVLRRVDRMIRDHTARMIEMKDTVILDGLVYRALNRRAVPRREFMFWRECWLERV